MLRRILCVVMVLMLMSGALAATKLKVNKDTQFYRSASTSSESLPIDAGVKVELKSTSGDWAKVTYKGVTGYMRVKDLDATKRAAAYVNQDTYLYAEAALTSAKKAVSVNTKVYVIGKDGAFARVQNESGSVTCYIESDHLSSKKVEAKQPEAKPTAEPAATEAPSDWKSKVVKMNWFDGGSSVLKRGDYGYIYDIDTGLIVHIKRMGGVNHADVEPATQTDTAKLKKIAGGSFSWDSQAVILYADGKFVACAINTLPHGDQTLTSNGYDGQFCLHMTGSRTHGSDSVNESHQKAINKAYNWAH